MRKLSHSLLLFNTIVLLMLHLSSYATVYNANRQGADSLKLNFIYQTATEGYACFRIPSIITLKSGVLLAFAEARKNNCGDSGDIDLVLKRSTDNGKTWGKLQVVWSDSTNTCGNAAPVIDKITGEIFLLACWNKGEDHEKEIIAQTSKDSRRVFVLSSVNEGRTWSPPKEITAAVKNSNWTWYATGPGHGIQIINGKYKGRLIIPVNHIDKGTNKDYVSAVYSDDHGKNWNIGNQTPQDLVNECTVAEIANGNLLMNMRNYDRKIRMRKASTSTDGGINWGEVQLDSALIEPICQASLLRYPLKGKKFALLFSNPANEAKRQNMTLKLSLDEGKTWKNKLVLHSGPAAYSDISVLKDGFVGCFYEAGLVKANEGIVFKRIKYEDLVNAKSIK
jgi:sialidase-1